MRAIRNLVDLSEVTQLIPAVQRELSSANNTYPVQAFANALYAKLSNTNAFSSLDLAGYLIQHSRMLGVELTIPAYKPQKP